MQLLNVSLVKWTPGIFRCSLTWRSSLTMVCLARPDQIAQGLAASVETVLQLDDEMAEKGLWPAINCSSVAHLPSPKFVRGASRQLAAMVKKYLSESREVSLHAGMTREFGLPLEDEARATLEYRHKLMALMQQQEPLYWEEQVSEMEYIIEI